MIMQSHKKKVRNLKPVTKRPAKLSELNHATLLADLEPVLKICNAVRDKYLKRAKDAQKSVEMYRAKIKKLDAKLPVFSGTDLSDPRYFFHARLSAHDDIKDLYEGLASDLEYKPAKSKNTYATIPSLDNLLSTRPWDFSAFDTLAATQVEEEKFLKEREQPIKSKGVVRAKR